jgi:hypothetical protein
MKRYVKTPARYPSLFAKTMVIAVLCVIAAWIADA